MRDTLKPEAYFQDYISDLDRRLHRFQGKIDANEVREDRMGPVKAKMFSMKLDKVIAMYSGGQDLADIKEEFEASLDEVFIINGAHRYVEIVQLLVIAVMLEVSGDKIKGIKDVITRDGMSDFLLDYFLGFFFEGTSVSDNALHKSPYGKLKPIIERATDPIEGIRDYLSTSWYKGHSDMGWYNSHDHDSDIYSGYWSFESGAIIHILGIDDSSLAETKYYPFDMANFSKD